MVALGLHCRRTPAAPRRPDVLLPGGDVIPSGDLTFADCTKRQEKAVLFRPAPHDLDRAISCREGDSRAILLGRGLPDRREREQSVRQLERGDPHRQRLPDLRSWYPKFRSLLLPIWCGYGGSCNS